MGAEQQSNLEAAQDLLHKQIHQDVQGEVVGGDLIGVYDVLKEDHRLLRALTDPSRSAKDRQSLAAAVFGSKIQTDALDVVQLVVGQHWAHPEQLAETMRELALDAFVLAESHDGRADLSQELVDAYALIASNRELRIQLSDLGEGDPDQRAELAGKIFEGHVSPIATRLIKRAAHDVHYGHLVQFLRRMATRVSKMSGKILVVCTTAQPLDDAQVERMRALAETRWKKPVDLALLVDPSIMGGFRLDAGEEAIDTSIRSDINLARIAMVK